MHFAPPLITATLLKRYKRFLVDVKFPDGTTLTAHCPNTGSMRSCSTPGSLVGLSISPNPKRKYAHTLEMIQDNGTWVGVNTSRTNHLVSEAIEQGRIAEFQQVETIKKEVKVSDSSRLDLVVVQRGEPTYIEIKNCSLVEDGCAMFPDAVTARGTKHLLELMELVEKGQNACIFFLIQRVDADEFKPAEHIDPLYAQTLREAEKKGVMVLAYQARVSPAGIEVARPLPVIL